MVKKSNKARKGKGLMCHHCGHIWGYKGESDLYVTCPICHYKIMISKGRKLWLAHERARKQAIAKKAKWSPRLSTKARKNTKGKGKGRK